MERLEAFEKMLADTVAQHEDTVRRMSALKAQGREKSATYRQLMGQKLSLMQLLERYRVYGLMDTKE